jgi:hypothetical protein
MPVGGCFLGDAAHYDLLKRQPKPAERPVGKFTFCLMRNRYHRVVETPNPDPVVGMVWLQSTYYPSQRPPQP